MIKEKIEKVISGENLSFEESVSVMSEIMEGSVNNSLIAALIVGLKSKGEDPAEVAGFVQTMRNKSVKINCEDTNAVDVCGTGGDESGTFNISTAAAFAVAGAGVTVAKHGNRSISSKCGSADVLTELGIDINLTPEQTEKALKDVGISFMFAPLYHPAMKHVMPVRRELAMRTVFNMLGPLTNPAGVKRQLIGTFGNQASDLMANAVEYLEMEKVCLVCTNNKYDEITLNGETDVKEFSKDEGVKSYKVTNQTFGYPVIDAIKIQGASANENAALITKTFMDKKKNEPFYVVAANAAFGLYASGIAGTIKECQEIAEESILSGKALQKLEQLREFKAD